jgi:hypothetical protein
MGLKLITETSFDCELTETKSHGASIVGIYSSAGLKNNNGRIYDREVLAREITKIDEKAKDKTLWGELGHPPNPEINPERIAILTTMLEWKGDHVYGKSKVLDTPTGQIAKTLIKEGKLGISSRGLGTVSEEGHVNEDFNLITWDLVTDPSNHPSWVNGIFEGKTWASTDDVLFGIVNTNDRLNGLPKDQEIELILDRLQPILKCPKDKIWRLLEGNMGNISTSSYTGIDVTKAFGVFRTGGQVGQKHNYSVGGKTGKLIYTFDSMDKAKTQVKISRKHLSPGEKKYYGMNYFAAKVSDAKKL